MINTTVAYSVFDDECKQLGIKIDMDADRHGLNVFFKTQEDMDLYKLIGKFRHDTYLKFFVNPNYISSCGLSLG